ncbi:hypothetical protein ACHAW6_006534 [Cyclotella cf. meneghiniana]
MNSNKCRSNLALSTKSPAPSLSVPTAPSRDTIGAIRSASCPEMRREELSAMMTQEKLEVYQCCDYLAAPDDDDHELCDYSDDDDEDEIDAMDAGSSLNAACRTSICEWMYRVVDHFGVDREVVAVAMSYTDRLLSLCHCPSRQTFNLVSSTALHLAVKIHSPWRWKEVGPLLPVLSRGGFDQQQMVEMENEMTLWLQWYLNQATPQCMAMHILSLIHVKDDDDDESSVPSSILTRVADTALFLIELAVCDYHFVPLRNSIVAVAAVLNAIEMIESDPPRDDHVLSRDASLRYAKNLRKQTMDVLSSIRYKFKGVKVSSARNRLWSLYGNSEEYGGSSARRGCGRHAEDAPATPLPPERMLVRQISSPTSCRDVKRIQAISGVPGLEFSVSSDDSRDGCGDVSCAGARYSF